MAKRRTKGAGTGWNSETRRRFATPAAKLAASVVVLLSVGLIAAHLAGIARLDRRFLVFPASILDENRPSWLPEEVLGALRADLQRIEPISIFAKDFGSRMSRSLLSASPWIDSVLAVERVFPNRARVELELRRPVISIDRGPYRFLLDREAICLHREDRASPGLFRRPVLPVVGARPGTEPRLGQRFEDPEVVAAIQVAEELKSLDERQSGTLWRIRPVALEVRRSIQGAVAAPGEVHLRTANGVLVEWGRAQESAQFGKNDLLPSEKVEHLERILEVFPGLVGLEEARLNFDLPHYRRVGGPLSFLKGPEPPLETPSDS